LQNLYLLPFQETSKVFFQVRVFTYLAESLYNFHIDKVILLPPWFFTKSFSYMCTHQWQPTACQTLLYHVYFVRRRGSVDQVHFKNSFKTFSFEQTISVSHK
jgi:hypothetical protein